MESSGQEGEIGAGAADLGELGGYIRPTAGGGTEVSPEGLLLGEDKSLGTSQRPLCFWGHVGRASINTTGLRTWARIAIVQVVRAKR